MTKLELAVVVPMKPLFYKRFIDDIITRRKRNTPDILLQQMNAYHSKINFTFEDNPSKFLDTKLLVREGGSCETRVYRKPNRVPSHWLSKTPIRYKRNAITGDLHRSKKISSCFQEEVDIISNKFLNAGFPRKFVRSTIKISFFQDPGLKKISHYNTILFFLNPSTLYFRRVSLLLREWKTIQTLHQEI